MDIKKLMAKNHIQTLKKPAPAAEPTIVTDEMGNKYREEIGTDGSIHLILVESYTGELFD